MKVARLLFWSAVAYGILLFVAAGFFPSKPIPSISLTGIPLIVIAYIIARDLARRSTVPTATPESSTHEALKTNPVQFLGGQIRVAAYASNSYFENVVRMRLRELLITKMALEMGLENEIIRRVMLDPRKGPRLLKDQDLYDILYGPAPWTDHGRMMMIENAIDLIGAWKG